MRLSIALLVTILGTLAGADGFAPAATSRSSGTHLGMSSAGNSATTNYLLDEFKTASGEIVDPYKVLKVSRTAERKEIREAYRAFSRKYHPDGARFREILPGSCNNHDDIREEWERIKLSYEILSDKKTRMRYDRHSVIADPGKAMQRAVLEGVGWGLKGVGKGLFHGVAGAVKVGASAVEAMSNTIQEQEKQRKEAASESSKNVMNTVAKEEEMEFNDPARVCVTIDAE